MIAMDARLLADNILKELGHDPTAGQRDAIEQLAVFITHPIETRSQPAFLLRGYAGTGKTTLVSALVRVLPFAGLQSVLMAPTGRAAKVLARYSRKKAHTIHRKIYRLFVDGEGRHRMISAPNPNKFTLFIVDEASMIAGDTSGAEGGIYANRDLLDDLVNYIYQNEGCKLLLIGDNAQLPPVGVEQSPALDTEVLVKKYHLDISSVELTEVMRQALESGVLVNASRLRNITGDVRNAMPFFNVTPYADIQRIDGTTFEDALNSCYSRYGIENTAIITRSNKRANLFNQEVRARMLFRDTELSAGDIIMVTRNNYFWLPIGTTAGFIANGDMAEIRRIIYIGEMYGYRFADVTLQLIDYPDQEVIEVKLLLDSMNVPAPAMPQDEMQKLYDEIMLDYIEVSPQSARFEKVKSNPYYNAIQAKFAYALTCHKTQGGQWDAVFIDHGYLTDEMVDVSFIRWLYTAITRATKEVYLVNFKDTFFE